MEEELSPPILLEVSFNYWRVENYIDIVFIKVEFYDKNNSIVYYCITNYECYFTSLYNHYCSQYN